MDFSFSSFRGLVDQAAQGLGHMKDAISAKPPELSDEEDDGGREAEADVVGADADADASPSSSPLAASSSVADRVPARDGAVGRRSQVANDEDDDSDDGGGGNGAVGGFQSAPADEDDADANVSASGGAFAVAVGAGESDDESAASREDGDARGAQVRQPAAAAAAAAGAVVVTAAASSTAAFDEPILQRALGDDLDAAQGDNSEPEVDDEDDAGSVVVSASAGAETTLKSVQEDGAAATAAAAAVTDRDSAPRAGQAGLEATANKKMQLAKKAVLQARKKIASLEARLVEKDDLLQTREKQLDKLQARMAAMQTKHDEMTDEMERLRLEKNSASSFGSGGGGGDDQAELAEQLASSQAEVSRLTRELTRVVKEKNREMEGLEVRVAELAQECHASKEHLESMRTRLKQKQSSHSQSSQETEELREHVEELQRALREKTLEIQQAQSTIADQEFQLQTASTDLAEADEQLMDLRQQVDEAAQMREDAQNKLKEQNSEQAAKESREVVLRQNIQEKQGEVNQLKREFGEREEQWKREKAELIMNLQHAEEQAENAQSAVPQATRPLQRQILQLQRQLKAKMAASDAMVAAVREKLEDREEELSRVKSEAESDRSVVNSLRSELAIRTDEAEHLREEVARLGSDLHDYKTKLATADSQLRAQKEKALLEQSHFEEVLEERNKAYRKLKESLSESRSSVLADMETQLDRERQAREALADEVATLRSALAVHHSVSDDMGLSVHAAVPTLQRFPSRESNRSAGKATLRQEDILQHSLGLVGGDTTGRGRGSSDDAVDDDSGRSSAGLGVDEVGDEYASSGDVALVQELRSRIRQREGEIYSLRSYIRQVEMSRDQLSDQLVSLTAKHTELTATLDQMPEMNKELQALNVRHDMALQIIGEKEDELEDLRQELTDVKETFRNQIDGLLARIRQLEGHPNKRKS